MSPRWLFAILASLAAAWCVLRRGQHTEQRHPLGVRCPHCGTALDLGTVDPARKIGPRGHELDERFRRAQR